MYHNFSKFIIYMIICFTFAAPLDCKSFETRDSLAFCYIPNPEFLGNFQSIFTD